MKALMTCMLAGLPLAVFCQDLTVTYGITTAGYDQVEKGILMVSDSLSSFIIPPESPLDESIKDKRHGFLYETNLFLTLKYSVKDSLHTMKWQLTGDRQTILNYPCLSATTVFRGRQYTAYYTTKLPVADGPWKLGGLPGLIMTAKSTDGYIEWKATSVSSGKVAPIDIAARRLKKNLSWQEYVAKFKQDVLKYTKYVRSQGVIADDDIARIKMGAAEIYYPELQTSEGLSY